MSPDRRSFLLAGGAAVAGLTTASTLSAAPDDDAKKFIADQPSDVQIGLVEFAAIALLAQQPTIDREPLYAAIDNFELRRGTAVGSGILASLRTIFPDQDFGTAANGGFAGPGGGGASSAAMGFNLGPSMGGAVGRGAGRGL